MESVRINMSYISMASFTKIDLVYYLCLKHTTKDIPKNRHVAWYKFCSFGTVKDEGKYFEPDPTCQTRSYLLIYFAPVWLRMGYIAMRFHNPEGSWRLIPQHIIVRNEKRLASTSIFKPCSRKTIFSHLLTNWRRFCTKILYKSISRSKYVTNHPNFSPVGDVDP